MSPMKEQNDRNDTSETTSIQAHHTLQEKAQEAARLVNTFCDIDPFSPDNDWDEDVDTTGTGINGNPWHKPNQMMEKLSKIRAEIVQAWETLEACQSKNIKNNQNNIATLDSAVVKARYVDMLTDAFGDILEEMRLQPTSKSKPGPSMSDPIQVDVLVDCLQSGLELLTEEEQAEMLFSKNMDEERSKMTKTDNVSTTTAHERHQQKLGFRM